MTTFGRVVMVREASTHSSIDYIEADPVLVIRSSLPHLDTLLQAGIRTLFVTGDTGK